MIKCVRRIQFCSGHRVYRHESKCANVHGHNYIAYIHATADKLDEIGRIIDFSVLKERIGGWIDTHWDHSFIVYEQDEDLMGLVNMFPQNKPVFIAPFNPTAENMASYLLNNVCPDMLSSFNIIVNKVVLYETENCFAEVDLE